MALTAGLVAPVLLLSAGAALDYASMSRQKGNLQAAADAAALATAREAPIHGWDNGRLQEIAAQMLELNVEAAGLENVPYTQQISINQAAGSVRINVEAEPVVIVMKHISNGETRIKATATASYFGQGSICVQALEEGGKSGLKLKDDSYVNAQNCAVLSNARSEKGIEASGGSELISELTCSAGGYEGSTNAYTPVPTTDCPVAPDPLQGREVSSDGSCLHDGLKIEGGYETLSPGVYCGKTEIKKEAEVTLEPGLYVFRDGELKLSGNASLSGTHVTLQFSGEKSGFKFENESTLALSAPADGETAGILIQTDRQSEDKRKFQIMSREAEEMIGVIYVPTGDLKIGGDGNGDGLCDLPGDLEVTARAGGDDDDEDDDDDNEGSRISVNAGANPPTCTTEVGQSSDWTSIIASKIEFTKGARVQLNADYAVSDIPLPQGLNGNIRLID